MGELRAIVFTVFGLVFGSFLTVVVWRVPRNESIVSPGSACPSCGEHIGAIENIPIASYIALRGRCRHCGSPIAAEYPLTEVATALLFLGASVRFASIWVAGVMAAFFWVMLACALIDVHHRIVPNRIVYTALPVFFAAILIMDLAGIPVSMSGAAIGLAAYGGVLFMMALLLPRGMGMGDAKLAGVIGLVLGALGLRYVAVAAAMGVLAGGLGSVVALALGRSRKDTIPFGPYLAAGAVAAAFAASSVAAWYTGMLAHPVG